MAHSLTARGTHDTKRRETPVIARAADFLALLKLRVMSLAVFTGFAGIVVAPGPAKPGLASVALLAMAMGAGGSAALNMALDSDIDAQMARTRTRPIPMGHISRRQALFFGSAFSLAAIAIMTAFASVVAALLLAFTVAFYVGVYTLWLKRRTPQNIVIGGLAGALPPAIGWAATTGSLSLGPLLLVLIIFLWTPPHFWALALFRSDDYKRAGVPMMPVARGKASTRRQIMFYSLTLLPAGILPVVAGIGGPLYLAIAGGFGGAMACQSFMVLVERDQVHERAARKLFFLSLLYLFALFAALILERVIGISSLRL